MFLYIVPLIASEPSTCTSHCSNLDACPIKTLLEVVDCVISYRATIQGSFSH